MRYTPKLSKILPPLTLAWSLALLGGCRGDTTEPPMPDDQVVAHAELYDAEGNLVADAEFSPLEDGAAITVDVFDLPPGLHGFHIHEIGSCEAPDFKSAGGHFNPFGVEHGLEDPDGAHLGDLPNIAVGVDGEAEIRMLVEGVSLEPSGQRSLIAGNGTAVVVHLEPDDYETDPAGAAGPRIACGVIEYREQD